MAPVFNSKLTSNARVSKRRASFKRVCKNAVVCSAAVVASTWSWTPNCTSEIQLGSSGFGSGIGAPQLVHVDALKLRVVEKGASSTLDVEAPANFGKQPPAKPSMLRRAFSLGGPMKNYAEALAKHTQEKAAFEAEQEKAAAEKARVEVEQYAKTFTGDIIKNVLAGFPDEAPKIDMAEPEKVETKDDPLEEAEDSAEDSTKAKDVEPEGEVEQPKTLTTDGDVDVEPKQAPTSTEDEPEGEAVDPDVDAHPAGGDGAAGDENEAVDADAHPAGGDGGANAENEVDVVAVPAVVPPTVETPAKQPDAAADEEESAAVDTSPVATDEEEASTSTAVPAPAQSKPADDSEKPAETNVERDDKKNEDEEDEAATESLTPEERAKLITTPEPAPEDLTTLLEPVRHSGEYNSPELMKEIQTMKQKAAAEEQQRLLKQVTEEEQQRLLKEQQERKEREDKLRREREERARLQKQHEFWSAFWTWTIVVSGILTLLSALCYKKAALERKERRKQEEEEEEEEEEEDIEAGASESDDGSDEEEEEARGRAESMSP